MGDTYGDTTAGGLATTDSFDYSIYNAIYWLIFLMVLSWLLRFWARCRHVYILWNAVHKQSVVRLDAGFEIRAHEMTRATLQALLKNHSRYDIRPVVKYRPAAHVLRETARLVPITADGRVTATTSSSSPTSSALVNGQDPNHGQIGDYHLQMRMAIANPVMVHIYMGVTLTSVRQMFSKYDMLDNDTPGSHDASNGRKKAPDVPSSSVPSIELKHGSTVTRVGVAAATEIKVGQTAPVLFDATEYLFTHSLKVVPTANITDVSMTLPRDWFTRCLSSGEVSKRHPFIMHVCPIPDPLSPLLPPPGTTATAAPGGTNGHTVAASTSVPLTARSANASLTTPSAATGPTLNNSRPVTPTRPSISSDHDQGRTPQPSPPSTPFGWDSPHATASEVLLVTFTPLPPPPSAMHLSPSADHITPSSASPSVSPTTPPTVPTPPAAAATAATAVTTPPTAAATTTNTATGTPVLVSTPPSSGTGGSGGDGDTKVSTAEQASAMAFDIQVSRAKFDRQLLLADGLLFDVQEIYGLNEESLDCSICMSNPRDIVMLPCRHCCVCATCHSKTDKCPVCRGPILNYMQFDATPIAARISNSNK